MPKPLAPSLVDSIPPPIVSGWGQNMMPFMLVGHILSWHAH